MNAAAIKNFMVSAYCCGWMPAWAVSVAFSIFRLKGK